jgi:D-alanyl-D-alanine carboxypeptidase
MKKFIPTVLLSCLLASSAYALPDVTAQAWLVADQTGKILQGTHTTDIRSIASITKLMTVMVVLDSEQSLTEIIKTKLYGKQFTRQELIDLSMVNSSNEAAKLLCQSYPTGYKGCIIAMNDKANQLNMPNTSFMDPTGLFHLNVSTAEDLIKLVSAASHYPAIVQASGKNSLKFALTKKNRFTEFRNTNTLVGKGYNFIVSKTGYINKSGGCIVFMVETMHGIRTVVLLGSKNTKTRIPEAQMLASLY